MSTATTSSSSETITRILHISPKAHIYAIPPLRSTKGHVASLWTQPPSEHIFTARVRILETSSPSDKAGTKPAVAIQLEDPATGDLFARCPYTDSSAVEAAVDSTRFFAIRVVGEGRQKAVLGMGFEERAEAFDFGVALQEVRKVVGIGLEAKNAGSKAGAGKAESQETSSVKRDFSLKEGQMLTVDVGKGLRRTAERSGNEAANMPPPSGGVAEGGVFSFLPPPPTAQEVRQESRRKRGQDHDENDDEVGRKSLKEMGFDDGEFGEFQ